MSSSEKTSLGRKVLKIAGIVSACVLGLVLILTILLLTVLEPYAESFLKKQVTENTDGLYKLDLEDIDINLLATTVNLKDIRLSPDSAVHRQQREAGEASPMLVELETQKFTISGINLIDAIFRQQLSIGTVFMDSPEITVLVDKSVEKEDAEEEQNNGGALTDFVESVEIGEIDIPEATVHQYFWGAPEKPVHEVPHLSLRVLALELDLLNQDDYTQIFDADDIQLELRDYAFYMPDSVYNITFNLFSYSSEAGQLQLEGFRVTADHEANMALSAEDASQMLFGLLVPRLQLDGFDIVEAYRTKQLQMGRLTLENTELEMLENPYIAADTATLDLHQLYGQASDYLKAIGLEEVHLADARLVYRTKLQEVKTVQYLDKLNVSLQDVQLDSATIFTSRDSLPVQGFLVTAEGYRYRPPQTPYTYDVARLELSSREKYLHVDSISVKGDRSKNDSLKTSGNAGSFVFDFKSPGLRIDDMDLLQAFQTKMLDIGSAELLKPALDVTNFETVPAPDLEVVLQNAYEQFSGFIDELKVRQIRLQDAYYTQHIKNGDITLSQELEEGALTLTGLHIDSLFVYEQEPRLPLHAIVLSGRSYKHWIPDNAQTFSLGRFRYSTRSEELTARSIELTADTEQDDKLKRADDASQSLFDFSAPLFRVTGLNVIRAMNSGSMAIDQMTLSQPDVVVTMDRDVEASGNEQGQATAMLFSFFDPVTVNAIHLEDGTFTYREKREDIFRTQKLEHASVTVTALHLSPEALSDLDNALPMEELALTASDFTYQTPDSVYTITLDSLAYSSSKQVLTARLFEVTSDKEAHERIKEENFEKTSSNLFDIAANKFQMTGFDLIRSYETGRYTMAEVILTEPEVAILQDRNVVEERSEEEADASEGNDTDEENGGQEEDTENTSGTALAGAAGDNGENKAMQQVSEFVETFRVGRIRVEDGRFKLNILKDTIQRSHTLEHVSVVVEELRLASLEAPDPLEMFEVDDIGILVQEYAFITPDSLYAFRIGGVRTELNSQTLTIDSVRLVPLFEIDEYQDKLEYTADRIDLKIPNIQMEGFRLDALFNNQEIIASKIQLSNLEIDIFRDNRVEADPGRQPFTLQTMLKNVEFLVQIDTVTALGGKIVYSEISADGTEPGVLTLDETVLLVTNITNDSLQIREQNTMTAEASTNLMGESILRVKFEFYMDHPEDLYTYEGSLEPMKFEAFNPLFEQVMLIRMESGRINKADFAVRATEHIAKGQIRFLYDDLDIQLIDKEDPENPGFFLNTGSWLINNLIIKDNNPSSTGNFREGEIEEERNYRKSVFFHMGGAMVSGMVSSLMPGWIERIVDALVKLPYKDT
ncbi:hypothetical protein ACFSKU_14750 [Pontibacter silvestris]|uniref:AsmA-like C-terminal domain-containing protein n=1 Tax=Pontibacter silvestris TaxID=2305183 RepID=A0ABW4X1K4_9BACT|nr:hypothetical protein [Pontibacter silvestris]MCC9138970.1 hypothetical protein [Pontibacter silvestris]